LKNDGPSAIFKGKQEHLTNLHLGNPLMSNIWQRIVFTTLPFLLVSCGTSENEVVRTPVQEEKTTTDESEEVTDEGQVVQEEPEELIPEFAEWKDEYENMNRVLQLSSTETVRLVKVFKNTTIEYIKWERNQQQTLVELQKQMKEAEIAKDEQAFNAAKEKAIPLQQAADDMVRRRYAKLLEALTKSRQAQWEAHRLTDHILNMMANLELSQRQISEIHGHTLTPIAAAYDDPKVTNPMPEAFMNCEKIIETEVLNEIQRKIYEDVKKKYPFKPPATPVP